MSTLQVHRAAIVAALALYRKSASSTTASATRTATPNSPISAHTPPPGSTPAEPHIRGWWVRRSATAEHSPNLRRTVNVQHLTVRGYLAFRDADATELVLDSLVEQFRAVVRADPTLGGVCQPGPLAGRDDSTDGVQVVDAGPVVFSGGAVPLRCLATQNLELPVTKKATHALTSTDAQAPQAQEGQQTAQPAAAAATTPAAGTGALRGCCPGGRQPRRSATRTPARAAATGATRMARAR